MDDLFADLLPVEPVHAAAKPTGPRHNIVVGMASWADPSLIKTKAFYPKGHSSSEKMLR